MYARSICCFVAHIKLLCCVQASSKPVQPTWSSFWFSRTQAVNRLVQLGRCCRHLLLPSKAAVTAAAKAAAIAAVALARAAAAVRATAAAIAAVVAMAVAAAVRPQHLQLASHSSNKNSNSSSSSIKDKHHHVYNSQQSAPLACPPHRVAARSNPEIQRPTRTSLAWPSHQPSQT